MHTFRPSSRRLTRLVLLSTLVVASTAIASAATLCVNPAGTSGCKKTISAAIAAAAWGDTIQVGAGTYKEEVVIQQSVNLIAGPGAVPVIDATGQYHGIAIDGLGGAPGIGVRYVTIRGFAIQNANYEGILVANSSNVTLIYNHVFNNNKKLSSGTCPGIPSYETSEAMDCGEGVHLMGTNHVSVIRNLIENNSGGILITDETGPSSSNLVKENIVQYNPFACGITMAGHPPATGIVPSAVVPFGISHNIIADNESHHNGLGAPGAGAGVGIFAPFPGTSNTSNVVTGNNLHDNGLPGVTMHNHASAPAPAPPINLDNNVIIGNHIHSNAADTADAFTPGPTGINIYSTAPVNGLIIDQNVFDNESIDIAFKVPAISQIDVEFNDFNGNALAIDNLGGGTVNAVQNWWSCAAGPGAHCSTTAGTGITTAPWLSTPFEVVPTSN